MPDVVEMPGSDIPLLEVRNLTVVFGSGRKSATAVQDVDLSIDDGQIVSLIGGSGSGKTTTARVIAGLLKASAGHVKFRGRPVEVGRAKDLMWYRRLVQVVFQDPYSSLNPRMTIEELVGEPLRHLTSLHSGVIATQVDAALGDVGLSTRLKSRLPRELSGGQRQRVAIARALSVSPALLICDEAVSALDVSVKAQILSLLRDVQVQRDLALLFITHDLALLPQLGGSVAVMLNGSIVERGPVADVVSAPKHAYTRELVESVPMVSAPNLALGTR